MTVRLELVYHLLRNLLLSLTKTREHDRQLELHLPDDDPYLVLLLARLILRYLMTPLWRRQTVFIAIICTEAGPGPRLRSA